MKAGWQAVTRLAAQPRLPWVLGLLALTLTVPALATGLQFDDFLLRARLRGPAGLALLPQALARAFVFTDGNAAHGLAQMASGALPWWALPAGQVAFWRPVAALTHWLDFALWPDQPARVRSLATGLGLGPVRLTRTGANSLLVTPSGGFLTGYDSVFRGPAHPLALVQVVHLGDLTATVQSLAGDGRPATVLFQFAVPLEDVTLRWFRWRAGLYVPFTPPAVGDTVELPSLAAPL